MALAGAAHVTIVNRTPNRGRALAEAITDRTGVPAESVPWEGDHAVPEGTRTLILEGVGSNQRPFAHLIDVTVWIQADYAEAERRGIARDVEDGGNGDAEESIAFWHEWMGHENAFYQADRPWERADVPLTRPGRRP